MQRVAALALLLGLIATGANAQNAPQHSPQAANGIIMQAIQPGVNPGGVVTPNSPQITSMVWLYDTNKSQMQLCKSYANGQFDCVAAPINWKQN